jgi:hypothetical protein
MVGYEVSIVGRDITLASNPNVASDKLSALVIATLAVRAVLYDVFLDIIYFILEVDYACHSGRAV